MPRRTSGGRAQKDLVPELWALARAIDPVRAEEYERRLAPILAAGSDALAVATLLASANRNVQTIRMTPSPP